MRVLEVSFMKNFKTLYFISYEGMSHWKKSIWQLNLTELNLRRVADGVFNTTDQMYEIDKN